MYTLTLQIFANGTWQDAMTLAFEASQKGFEQRMQDWGLK